MFPAGRSNTGWPIEISLKRVLGAALLILAQPAAAQDRQTEPDLKSLIPDSAVKDPETWAKAAPHPDVPAEPGIDVTSPMSESGGISLPWPDPNLPLPPVVSLDPDRDAAQALQSDANEPLPLKSEGDLSRISQHLALVFAGGDAAFPDRHAFEERFRALSAIENLAAHGDVSPAQVAVRALADRSVLLRLLQVYGYYDAEVVRTIDVAGGDTDQTRGQANVRFEIYPGPRFRFGKIELGTLVETGADYPHLRSVYAISPGDPLLADRLAPVRVVLGEALGETGYAFAKLGEPDLLVDHRREEGDLTQPVSPGGKYRIGGVTSNLPGFLSSSHLEQIARFRSGDLYRQSQVDDLRRAILATGLVSSVALAPRETAPPQAGAPGTLDLDTTLVKAPLRTIAAAGGYDSGDGVRVELSWQHRNLFPPEGMLRLRGIAGTTEQLAGVTFRKNNYHGRDQVLTLDLYADNANRTAYAARTVAVSAIFEKLTTLIFQKPWTWSVGIEALASDEREGIANGVTGPRTVYVVGALPLRVSFDGSDDLLDAHRGFRAALRVSPEISRSQGSTSNYVRIQADASFYQPLGSGVVLAARTRLGSIPGAALTAIAPSRRFYAGGGGSVRGYGFQLIGPRNALDQPTGGRSLAEFSLEARIKTPLSGGALSLVPFIDAGSVDSGAAPGLSDVRYGAGLGLRYLTSFGPIRIDVGTPLGRRTGESRIGVYVALGQSF